MPNKRVEGITKISVKGFKSIAEEREIEIRPLTILAGANSSGKTSIMQPLLMLKQTLEGPYDPGPLWIDGPNVKFTSADQFFSINSEESSRFHIQIETGETDSFSTVKTTYGKEEDEIRIIEMKTSDINDSNPIQATHYNLYPDMPPEEIKRQTDQDSKLKNIIQDNEFHAVKRRGCFLILETEDGRGEFNLASVLAYNIMRCIHLTGFRGDPERTSNLTSTGPWYIGRFENYVASLIHEWQEKEDNRLQVVVNALRKLKLTGHVRTKKIGDVRIELKVSRLPISKNNNADMVSIADVGFGVSQVLPVIVALIAAAPGQLVYLEQPELHLHPNAQFELARIIADSAKRGVSIVVETHSSLLLLGVQTLVAEGKLPPDLVKLHWFTRSRAGITKVDSKDLDEAGTYGKWSADFDKVSMNAQRRFLNAVDIVKFGDEEVS